MAEWVISLEGTEAGSRFAMVLAISAAFLHAVFGALQKGRHDPWLTRGAIDFGYFSINFNIISKAIHDLPVPVA